MNILKVSLGGQERTLDIGKWYFQKYLEKSLGVDPLNPGHVNEMDWTVAFVFAGMMSDYSASKREPDFAKEDIEHWIGCLEQKDRLEFLKLLNSQRTDDPGEAPALENGA